MPIRRHRAPPRTETVSATAAAKNFGRLVDSVREERATYVVERSGTPVATISPADQPPFTFGDLKALLAEASRTDEEYLHAVEQAAAARNRPRVRRNPWGR